MSCVIFERHTNSLGLLNWIQFTKRQHEVELFALIVYAYLSRAVEQDLCAGCGLITSSVSIRARYVTYCVWVCCFWLVAPIVSLMKSQPETCDPPLRTTNTQKANKWSASTFIFVLRCVAMRNRWRVYMETAAQCVLFIENIYRAANKLHANASETVRRVWFCTMQKHLYSCVFWNILLQGII